MMSRPKINITTDHIFIDGRLVGMYYAPLDTWLLNVAKSAVLYAYIKLPERRAWLTPDEFKLALQGKAGEVFTQRFVDIVTGGSDARDT